MKQLFDYTSYLFDLDGTVYVGEQALPGAAEAIAALRERAKRILFATNTTVYTREQVQDKLARLGIDCGQEEIMTALSVAGMYFNEHASGANVYLIGGDAMREEMEASGVAMTVDPMNATHVLVGLDKRFDYDKLTAGMNAVRNGALLIAANPDPFCPTDTGIIPDTWALVRAIETAGMLRTHAVIGKPSKYYASYALQLLGSRPEQCLMIGDRLETDVVLGRTAGMGTAFVLTGADSTESIARTSIRPDYIWASIAVIAQQHDRHQPSSSMKDSIEIYD